MLQYWNYYHNWWNRLTIFQLGRHFLACRLVISCPALLLQQDCQLKLLEYQLKWAQIHCYIYSGFYSTYIWGFVTNTQGFIIYIFRILSNIFSLIQLVAGSKMASADSLQYLNELDILLGAGYTLNDPTVWRLYHIMLRFIFPLLRHLQWL